MDCEDFIRTAKEMRKILNPTKRIIKFLDGTKMKCKDFNRAASIIRKKFPFVRYIYYNTLPEREYSATATVECSEGSRTVYRTYPNFSIAIDGIIKLHLGKRNQHHGDRTPEAPKGT